jgi:cytochrome P450
VTVLTERSVPGPAPVAHPEHLVDPALHATGDPHGIWRWMRERSPVYRHEAGNLPAFWSLTRYEDIRAVYRDPATFSSAHGVLLRPVALGEDPGAGQTLALTDPPRHKQLRALMADWFSTRAIRQLEGFIREAVRDALAHAVDRGSCDAVHDVAARISLHTIGRIIGVPREDQESLFQWTNEAFLSHRSLAAHHGFMGYFIDLMDQRTAEPADDLLSSLVHGTIGGEPLSEEEILLNCENLVGATENGRLALAAGCSPRWRRRSCAGPPAPLTACAPPPGPSRSAADVSRRATRSSSGCPPATATRTSSPTPTASTWAAPPTGTWRSPLGSTSASAAPWHAPSCACC